MSNTLNVQSQDDGNTIPLNIADPTIPGPPVDMTPPPPTNGVMPTGCKIILPVPALKTTADPLFIVRLSPVFMTQAPWSTDPSDASGVFFFPLQFPWRATPRPPTVKMLWELTYKEHIYNMMTHRFMTGQIDCILRISSNVNVTGSICVTEVQDVVRFFDSYTRTANTPTTLRYDGYRALPVNDTFSNKSGSAQTLYQYAHVHNSFALNDLSLTRHFELSTSYSFGETMFDHHLYLREFYNGFYEPFKAGGTKNLNFNYSFGHLFKENLLLVSPQTDITSEPGQLTFELLMDFSKVQYHEKLLDVLPNQLNTGWFAAGDIADMTTYYRLAPPSSDVGVAVEDATTQTESTGSGVVKKTVGKNQK